MQEEVSTSMHVSITVWLTAALISVVVGVLVMSINVLNGFADKYNTAIVSVAESELHNTSKDDAISGAVLYARITGAIDSIDVIKVYDIGSESAEAIYIYNDSTCQDLISLMTMRKNKWYMVEIKDGERVKSMKTVILTEVVR